MTFSTNFNVELGNGRIARKAELVSGTTFVLISIEKNGQTIKAKLDIKNKKFLEEEYNDVDKISVDSIVRQIIG